MERVIYMGNIYYYDDNILTSVEDGSTRKVSLGKPMTEPDLVERIDSVNEKYNEEISNLTTRLNKLRISK